MSKHDLDGIAIIGMSLRLPGASTPGQFWRNLADGVESISFFRDDEISGLRDRSMLRHPNFVPAGAVLDGIDRFDAAFFDIAPMEAQTMDPQHRLFLECCYEALEDAGCDIRSYGGQTGVFAGANMSTYLSPLLPAPVSPFQAVLGNDKDYLATRVSYKLNLTGPSISVQSACSTSLVAVSLACDSLLDLQCDLALAGGASIKVPHRTGYTHEPGSIFSRDGHCRSFDRDASGTVFGNGVGVVVLKRLEDAIRQGDRIAAVIRGTAVGNDGGVKAGYTTPGIAGQSKVIASALAMAGVSADAITFVEAHGTATPIGDPIEVEALTRAFRLQTERRGYCALGSVKSNFGHLESAAGIASLIKTVLSLEHKAIPPSLHFKNPNPKIEFDSSPFFVNAKLRSWETPGIPRRAGVSSFGIGGTNAHVVLEEAPPVDASGSPRRWNLLPLSAKTPSALDAAASRLASHMADSPQENLSDIAYTLASGRIAWEHRRVLVASGPSDGAAALNGGASKRVISGTARPRRRVAFLFPGQGSQYPGMAQAAYAAEPVYREAFHRCADLLAPRIGVDLRSLVYPPAHSAVSDRGLVDTALAQPALFAVEYSLVALWRSWGIEPDAMLGHSIGEYVAACLAGVFSLEDALAVVAERGRLMQGMTSGAMAAVALPWRELDGLLAPGLSVAAVNSPARCTVSGPSGIVDGLLQRLEARGIEGRKLQTSHAFHSEMMDPIVRPFEALMASVKLRHPAIPFLSNLTGTWIQASEATSPRYWAQHLRAPVQFESGVRALLEIPERVLVEVGPGRTLSALAADHPSRRPEHTIVSSLPHPNSREDDHRSLLTALGACWTAGVPIDWNRFYAGERRRKVRLPAYPFERRSFWYDQSMPEFAPPAVVRTPDRDLPAIDGGARPMEQWFLHPVWKRSPLQTGLDGSFQGLQTLIFADELGFGALLAQELERRGASCRIVTPGPACHPGRPEDYNALFDQLAYTPDAIFHLWSLPVPGQSFADAQDRGFYSLLHIAQALGRRSASQKLRLAVVASGLYDVTGEEDLDPAQAAILGPATLIPQEYPGISMKCIEIASPGEALVSPIEAPVSRIETLASRVLDEFAAHPGEPVVALRGAYRWTREFEPLALRVHGAPRIEPGGAYLITGGLGGIGLSLASHIASVPGVKLILSGRNVRDRQLEIARLREQGAEVLVQQADVTDRAQMQVVIDAALARYGGIRGVIHAAGIPGGGVIQTKTREEAARVLAPKVQGALILDSLLCGQPLDFFVLCSSVTAIQGGFGQVDYAAANAFLDVFAASKRSPRFVSMNWGAWKDVGMAARAFAASDAGAAPAALAAAAQGHAALAAAVDPAATTLAAAAHGSVDPAAPTLAPVAAPAIRYSRTLDAKQDWILLEHRLMGKPTVPGTAFLEIVRDALAAEASAGIEFSGVFFLAPLSMEEGEVRSVEAVLTGASGEYQFEVRSRAAGAANWTVHMRGSVASRNPAPARMHDLAALRAKCGPAVSPPFPFSGNVPGSFLEFGPRWKSITSLHFGEGRGFATLALPDGFSGDFALHALHPALLDVAAAFLASHAGAGRPMLPFGYGSIRVHGPLTSPMACYATCREGSGGGSLRMDIVICAPNGRELMAIEGFTLRAVETQAPANLTLQAGENAALHTLAFRPSARRAPRAGEVEIEAFATGLNFKDVLIALGMIPRQPLGFECAGRVVAAGSGVRDFQPGDAVVALANSSFDSFVVADQRMVAHKPPHLGFEQAAAIPLAFTTAYHSLTQLARLRAGERVLIHAAAGGVGQAAVQVARGIGAEIFATAGSEQKRQFLRGCGIAHVFDSRSLSFADEVMQRTDGAGVHVVLNCLSGAFAASSLSVLTPLGRFVELGLRDILAGNSMSLGAFAKGLSYFAFNLEHHATECAASFQHVMAAFASQLWPLPPLRVFGESETQDAFEYMMQAKHTGKIVIARARAASEAPPAARPGSRAAALAAREEALLREGISPAQGVEAFFRALGSGHSQVVIAPRGIVPLPAGVLPPQSYSAPQAVHDRPELSVPFAPPRNDLELSLAAIWQEVLGIAGIGIHDNFFELGGDSLLATQVIPRMRDKLGVQAPPAILFEQPTIAELAASFGQTTSALAAAAGAGREEGYL